MYGLFDSIIFWENFFKCVYLYFVNEKIILSNTNKTIGVLRGNQQT